jgi:hypothetical protein
MYFTGLISRNDFFFATRRIGGVGNQRVSPA